MEAQEAPHQQTQPLRPSRFRRKSQLQLYLSRNRTEGEKTSLWKEGTCHRDPDKDEENVTREINSPAKKQYEAQRRFPLMAIQNENRVIESEDTIRNLGSQSAKRPDNPEPNPNFSRRPHLRRSCAPRFIDTESMPQRNANATPYGGCTREPATTSYSSVEKPSEDQGETGKFNGSGFKSRFRRRSLLRRSRDFEARQNDENVDRLESNKANESERERTGEEEERRTGIMSSRVTRSTMKVDNVQEEEEDEHRSGQKSLFAGGLGKYRRRRSSILDMVKLQRAAAAQSSTEKPAVSEIKPIAPVGQKPGNSAPRLRLQHWSRDSPSGNPEQKDPVEMDKTEKKKLQECCRELKFENEDNSEDAEDPTTPLTMFTQTPILKRASVLQNPLQDKMQKFHEPVVKKSLLDGTAFASFKRRRSTQINQDNPKQPLSFGTGTSNITDTSSKEHLFGPGKEPQKIGHPRFTLGNATLKEEEEPSTSHSEVKSNFPAHSGSAKRVQRRRSAAVLCVRTPMKRRSTHLEAKSTSKLPGSVLSKPVHNGSQKRPKITRRIASLPLLSLPQTTDKIAASDMDCLEENETQTGIKNQDCHKVDAATNTTINLAKIKLVDLKILEEIEALLKEQNELNTKAVQLQERTTARRLEMKEKGLMESFMTSISPLRRLKAIFSENNAEEKLKENPPQCKPDDEGDVGKSAVTTKESQPEAQSVMEWKSPEGPLDLSQHQIQWRRRRQDNRLTRTWREPSIVEEEFFDACQGNTSPFTSWVGDCERPSLAPMTPHSRQDVFRIKLSIKEQLEKLYE